MTETICDKSKKCGGCQLMNLSYPEQLLWKQRLCVKLLARFGRVNDIIGAENPLHYRCKVQAAFGTTRGGKIISGVYQSGTHRIVAVDSCMIEDEKADEIIVTIRSLLSGFKLTAYDEFIGRGLLRHVLVRRGYFSGEIMVVLVTASPVFPSRGNFVNALLKKHPEITTVVQNVNPGRTSLVLGDNERVLFGKGTIVDSICGCNFRISSKSFYQINPVQTQTLYQKAIDFAALKGDETVLDAYCGVGTIGLVAAKTAGRAVGVELNPEAVADARANARLNGTKNISFVCADAGDFMKDAAENGEKADVVFIDPPRAGSTEKFLSALCSLAPKKIVYISCNPETQARDMVKLVHGGYKVTAIQPVDMFPYTHHVECVCSLELKK